MAKTNRTKLIIVVLIIVILILLSVILYSFVLKPWINGYVINKQIQAKDATLNAILYQIQQQGYTQIADSEGNTITLVPYNIQQAQEPNTQT